MALYRENSTGFLCEFASNPGASYTAVTAQPTDTVTNRVNWWRARNVDSALGQSSAWHPSLQQSSGYVEDPNPSPVLASGINIIPARYCAFDETNGLPTIAKSASATLSQVNPGGFYSDRKLRVVTSTTNQYFYLQATTTNYTIKLEPGKYWMFSFYVAPTTNAAVSINAVLRVKNSVSYTDKTVVLTSGATAGAWTRVVAGFDLSANSTDNTAQIFLRMPSAVTVDFDAFMLEEYDGSHLVPSPWYKPGGSTDIDGKAILPGSIPDATPFASSIVIPTIVSTLPTTGNYIGRIVFLTTDEHVYKYMSTGWKDTGDATQIVGQLVAGQIQAGAIGADQIAANAITTDKLVITGSNLIPNSTFATGDTKNWRPYSGIPQHSVLINTDASVPSGAPTRYVMRYRYTGAALSISTFTHVNALTDAGSDEDGFEVAAGQQYSVSISAAKSSGYASNSFRVMAQFMTSTGTIGTSITPIYVPVSSLLTAWSEFSGSFTVPANCIRCWMYVYDPNHTAGDVFWTRLNVHRRMSSELIVDGAITADKCSANMIVAGSAIIGDAAIEGAQIASATITNANISDLSASKLTAGTINASSISVTNLNATNITSGSINGGRIGDDTIITRHVMADNITYLRGTYNIMSIASTSGTLSDMVSITVPASSTRGGIVIFASMLSASVFSLTTGQTAWCGINISKSLSSLSGANSMYKDIAAFNVKPSATTFVYDSAPGSGAVTYSVDAGQYNPSGSTYSFKVSVLVIELKR